MDYPVFTDRQEAGKLLASKLLQYKHTSIVLALPRGGVVVGYEIAKELEVPLHVLVVRKLGVPWQKELGVGAIAEGGSVYLDHRAITRLGLSTQVIEGIKEQETIELHRQIEVYRNGKALPKFVRKTVILVDDGVATGVTMFAAILAVKKHVPKFLIVAVPVCSAEIANIIRDEVDGLVSLYEVWDMQSIGMYFQGFAQIEDKEVIDVSRKNKQEIRQRKKVFKPLQDLVAM